MRGRRIFGLALGLLFGLNAMGQNPLFIPDTLAGPTYNLTVAQSTMQFLPGPVTSTYGINADYLGPTLIMNKGDFITLNVTNNLPDTTTMHWHGMHVAASDDGGPHSPIAPGATWSPDFTVLDEATTFWYHPHLHHHTATQVNFGAAGMIIVRDSASNALNLPHTYGVDDFPLIIQDKSFDSLTNEFFFENMQDSIMVNGTLSAYLEVPAQMVRFRLLNASMQRVYNVGFPPGLPIFQIGSDGGLLNNPIAITRMLLAPGERAELVIDFSGQQTLNLPLMARNSEMPDGVSGAPNGPRGGPNNPLDGNDFPIIEFRVVAPTANAVTSLPAVTNHLVPFLEANADRYRTKDFTVDSSGFPFYINDELFDMMVPNDTVLLDDIEVWELINSTDIAHPFHIHDIQFFVLDVNGGPPMPHLRGLKDVVLSLPNDTIRFITKFTDFADEHTPYMYHCHNLFHEDAGMMGQFIVVDGGVSVEEALEDWAGYSAYPNPASDKIMLTSKEAQFTQIESAGLYSLQGQKIRDISLPYGSPKVEIPLNGLPVGMYLLKLTHQSGQSHAIRVVKM